MSQMRTGGFQLLPPAIKNIIIINVLVFLISNILGQYISDFMYHYFSLYNWTSPLFHIWQLVTHMFMHGSWSHLFFNMFALWMFGNAVENYMGTRRFLIFYFICGIGAACCYMITQNLTGTAYPEAQMVGASGAIMGLLFAFGYLFPNVQIYIYFLIPLRAKYFVAIYAALELFLGVQNNPGDNVAHFAHIGGMLFAFILLRIWRFRSNPYY